MALRDQPYLPLYVNDFLADEKLANCSAESNGVYIRLLCLMHKSCEYGKFLLRQKERQSGRQTLDFAVKLAKQMPYTSDVIENGLIELLDNEVIYIDGDALCQHRMIKDGEISKIRAKSGKKGAEVANANSKKKSGFADAKQSAKESAKQSANTEIDIIYETENENKLNDSDKEFEIFWSAYPKKVGKADAKKKFKTALTKVSLDTMLAALEVQKTWGQWQRDGGQYIPNASTWLNQERWNDEETTPIKGQRSGSPKTFMDMYYETEDDG